MILEMVKSLQPIIGSKKEVVLPTEAAPFLTDITVCRDVWVCVTALSYAGSTEGWKVEGKMKKRT